MTVHNREIAALFERLADLLEIEGANPFRVRAYRNASRVVGGLSQGVEDMLREGEDLSALPYIGEDLAEKIRTIVETGKLPLLEEVETRVPGELSELMKIPGLGPKRVKTLYQELRIDSLEDLERAIRDGKVRELEGFGKKSEEVLTAGIARLTGVERRTRLFDAEEVLRPLLAYLKEVDGVKQIDVAGSFRRRKETVGDLDILVTCKRGTPVADRFVEYDEVEEVVSHGETRSTVILRSGLQVDLRVVPEVSYGAAMHYFTGSKAHNIAVRKLGVKRGLKINEYGVFKDDKRVAGRTEAEVFKKAGLRFVEPELREDRGEIEAARKGKLPELVTIEDIHGDLHCHTKATDGHHTIEQMARAAVDRDYDYLAITDHTQRVTMAKGMDGKRLRRQMEEIDRLNDKLDGIVVLKGAEVDILEDGSLDLPDDVLEMLDFTVCAVHYNVGLSRDKQTRRIIRAMDNPFFNILAHPTGRLIGERDPYELDMERVMEAALERGCFLEVNAQPSRLDLTDAHCKMAKEMGLKVAISTDAHGTDQLDYMRLGVGQARRGWLEAADVVNTRPLRELKELLTRT
ncbi:MAG: DNA polymerase/3'-5' exonuclease PolX [Gammaproteobacteria bacterium]|nr:DNA polymerase/3'-5' exonuclease PolX [Gammaproteobacteria bacterium]NIR83977.1 DNA polymerase/3'-5' exonuclease PolX [Gammaproteobacteria bacterium]NIR89121.1 DNA polymerase/3'-5' exonuclease PolX [Gammaproteobacteria bacterium]NIU04923.1 DNA polymerase/3'-5' exonuclease PolX [Gammaproteobacteria bacterium]NIV52089.1 DNA polymerase/3'-5' exonuclease PolX [Gammaproteobacteria bacterium]